MPTRREFLWTAGGAAAALTLQGLPEVSWTPEQVDAAGWEPGMEALRNSTCLLCPSRCGIRGRAVDGRLVRILGNPLHPLSQGGVCPRGIAGVQLLYHPDRLASPLERSGSRGGGEWTPLTPEQALEQLATRLGALRAGGRPDRLAVVSGYARGTMDEVWRQFLRAFGSPHYVADDCNDATDVVMALMHGIPRGPAYDLERSGVVLSFGAPLFDAWWSPLQAYVAFGRPAGGSARSPTRPHVIQVDTRFSRTAARAHEWVGIRPGTHGVLALGVAYVLIKEELVDAEFLARHVSGFEDATDGSGAVREGYRSLVLRHYRTEEVSVITGVPVERVVSLAKTI
ncbi:MAG: molybdopterin-dependent oxidoreductase, partial [Gemmatimonadetes bacterium]|nr:molybdopterin-dependent oxidoreductase [Gemmatimonadota bacterium]